MKKILTITICVLLFTASQAQKISEGGAQQYLEKVWGYLKASDSISFVNLWLPEDSTWQKNHTSLDRTAYFKSFNNLRKWLQPVIAQNLDIDHIEIGESNERGIELKAYLKAKEHALIGFSFHVIPVNDKWSARGKPGHFAESR